MLTTREQERGEGRGSGILPAAAVYAQVAAASAPGGAA